MRRYAYFQHFMASQSKRAIADADVKCWLFLFLASLRTHCMDVFHYLAVKLQHVSLFEPTAWMYSITWRWSYSTFLCSNPLHGCIPLLGGEVTARFSVRTHCMDVFHYLAVKLQHVSLFEPFAWMYSITWRWSYSTFLCSNPLHGCIPLLGGEVTARFSVRTLCMDVFHYLAVKLQHVSLFEPTAWMYSITWRWSYNTFLCSNPLHGCIPLLGGEVTARFSVRTHCMDVFHYLAVKLQHVSLFEPFAWMYSITWRWSYNTFLCSNPLHGCIPILGGEVTARFSVRTHCMDVFHYLAVKLQHVSLFEPFAWMYSITWRWSYSTFLCSNPLHGCIPLLGGEVTARFSVRTLCMDVFHYLAVKLQHVSLFEPTAWMYSITWRWSYSTFLCSNPLHGCIPLLGGEVTARFSVRTHCMDVFHYLAVEVTARFSVRTLCMDVFHYLAVKLQHVSLFEPTAWMYSITWRWSYSTFLCSNPLHGCIPLLGGEVTARFSVRTHCMDVFHYLAVKLQHVSLFEPTAWMYSITWRWSYSTFLCSNPLHGCIPLLGGEVTARFSVRTHCMDVFHYLAVKLQHVSLFEPTAWMYSITWRWSYCTFLCSNPLHGCIPLLGGEVTASFSVRTHCMDVFHHLAVKLQHVSLFEPTAWMYSITWRWSYSTFLCSNPLHGCIPLLGGEVTARFSVRTHCMDVFHYLAVKLQHISLFEPTAWMYSITWRRSYNTFLCSNPLHGCIPLLGGEVTARFSVRTHCMDVFHYLAVKLQHVSLFEPTAWMYSITWRWSYSTFLCSNPLHGCIPLLGGEVTARFSVRTHCMDVFHYLAAKLQHVSLFEPTAWMYSITWRWSYSTFLCSNPLHGCIPLLGGEVTARFSVRTLCMDVFHYLAVKLQHVSLFEPTAWMYSITWRWSYNTFLCSNPLHGCIPLLGGRSYSTFLCSYPLHGCIPLLGGEVTARFSVRTLCMDVFHYLAVKLQHVSLFEPTAWMYSNTWRWSYSTFLCSNPLHGCIPLLGGEVTTRFSVRTLCMDVFHYLAVKLQHVSLFEPTAWMYSITWRWSYSTFLCSNPLHGCIPLLGGEVTARFSVRTHCMDVFHYLAVKLQHVSLFEPFAWMYSITWRWSYSTFLCSNPLHGCIPLLGGEVTARFSVRTLCMDVFHYLAVKLQHVSLFEPTAWMYSITWRWSYSTFLCSNPLHGCIPLLGGEVTARFSVRTHCMDVFHYLAVKLQHVSLFEPTAWMYSITWRWSYSTFLCSNPLHGCIPLLGGEVTARFSVRTHCMDVFHYLAVKLLHVSLFEPTAWMYSITWRWSYSKFLCSNPLHGCIPSLGGEVTARFSVRTHCMDVFHHLAVKLQHVSLFEPTAWMYSITWRWSYSTFLCSNPLHGCIPLLGGEVTAHFSVRTHCMDVFHYLAAKLQHVSLFEPTAWMYSITWRWSYSTFLCSNPLHGCIPLLGGEVTARFSVRTHCMDVFHYLAVKLQHVSLFEPFAWMYSITWRWSYSTFLCSNPLHGCIPLLGGEVTARFSVRTHCMDVFHYLAVKLQHVSLFEPTAWMYSITWRWSYSTFLCSNPLHGCIPLLGGEVTARFSVRTHCMDVFHCLAVKLQHVSLFEPTAWMYSITWRWSYSTFLCSNPLHGCIPLLGGEFTARFSVRTHCMDVFHYLAVKLQHVSLFELTVWMYSITWRWSYSTFLCSNPLHGCIPILGGEVTARFSVRTHCMDVFQYLAVKLQHVSLFEPTAWMYSITWRWSYNTFLCSNPLHGCIPILGGEVTARFSVRTHCMDVFQYLAVKLQQRMSRGSKGSI